MIQLSLWSESLSLCLYDSGDDLESRAKCILPYNILVCIGVWQAADKYGGPKVWVILSKLAVIFGILVQIFSMFILVSLVLNPS